MRRGAAFRMTGKGCCAAFRMTGEEGAALRMTEEEGAALRMTGDGVVYRVNFGVQTHGQIIGNVLGSMSLRSGMVSCGAYVRAVFAPCVLLSIGGRYGGKALAVPLWQTYKANLGRVDILKLSLITSVISSVGRNLKLETGGCATNLDSSLRCAALRSE